MKIDIENYRGWSIQFDTEQETFYSHSEEYDRAETKKSFASAKKFIDEFIKDNLEFKPVWVSGTPSSWRSDKIKLIGIRKDGKFVYEGKSGEKVQLPEYQEKDYFIITPENDIICTQVKELERKRKKISDEINNEIKELESKLVISGLGELKKRYSI